MSALGGIYAALKTLIATDVTTAALLANSPGAWVGTNGKAVYDDGQAPQNGSYPLVTVGAGTSVQASTFGSRGWNCTVQVKPIVQGVTDLQEIVTRLSAVMLPAAPRYLTVAGFTSCWIHDVSEQAPLFEIVAGAPTRSAPLIVRVYAT